MVFGAFAALLYVISVTNFARLYLSLKLCSVCDTPEGEGRVRLAGLKNTRHHWFVFKCNSIQRKSVAVTLQCGTIELTSADDMYV